MQIYVNGQQY